MPVDSPQNKYKQAIESGDPFLRDHPAHAARNAKYISCRIQIEIINAIGKKIRAKIVEGVNQSGHFTVLTDETRESGKTDQLTICVRYVTSKNDQKVIAEKFLIFCELSDGTGKGLGRTILNTLTPERVDVKNMRGQGYYGCHAMSGTYNGAQARIKVEVPEALLFHYLNLALANSSEYGVTGKTVGTIRSICAFISNSAPRVTALEEQVLLHSSASTAP